MNDASPKLKTVSNVSDVSINLLNKPVIEVNKGELGRMLDQAENALALTTKVYQRGGALVSLTDDGKTFPVCQASALILLSRAATWIKTETDSEGNKKKRKADPPNAIAAAMPKEAEWKTIPHLEHVVDHPLFCLDQKLLQTGYNAETKIFGNFKELESVNLSANKEDAKAALEFINLLFRTLDLETDHDKAAAVCAVLTAACRPVLKTAPIFLITAPVIGSGKGLLARLIAGFAQAGEPPAKTLQGDDEEIKKELISALLVGSPVLFFDEVQGNEIDSVPLRTLATSESFSGRLLGRSKNLDLSTRALILITGNNLTPSADTSRRVLEIRLNPKCECPATRKFETNPIAEMSKHRSKLIRAALTIQAAYFNCQKEGNTEPEAPGIGSFSDWNKMCRLPVLWLTGFDPAKRLLDQMKTDPARAELGEVLAEWRQEFGGREVTAAEVQRCQKVFEAIKAVAGSRNRDLSVVEVGRWIAKHKDRIVAGKKLTKSDAITNKLKWCVEMVSN